MAEIANPAAIFFDRPKRDFSLIYFCLIFGLHLAEAAAENHLDDQMIGGLGHADAHAEIELPFGRQFKSVTANSSWVCSRNGKNPVSGPAFRSIRNRR